MTNNEKEKESETFNLKIFTFRNIPEDLNNQWKLAATLEGITKEELGVKWLKESCESYFKNLVNTKAGQNLGALMNAATTVTGIKAE